MHRSVCGAVRDLRFAGRFFEQHSSGEVAIVVLTESAGGNNRWIPLGDHWSRERGAGSGEPGAGSKEPRIYGSPGGVSISIVPAKWRLLYSLNPLVGIIDGFRWAIIGAGSGEQGAGSLEQGAKSLEQGAASGLYLPGFLMSIGLVLMLLASGIWYFRRTERTFADVI